MRRVPVTRIDTDGTRSEGTASWDGRTLGDFRDGQGDAWTLPPGSRFEIDMAELGMADGA